MSRYENYDDTSATYAETRTATGSDVMCGMIQLYCGKQLKDMHVLDAGCGTGNYAKALLDYGIGHVTLLDASSGMLAQARETLADDITSGNVKDVVEAKMPPMPFPDGSFDVVLLNLVLHHLDKDSDSNGGFPTATAVMAEARRVLRSRGLIIISTVLPWAFESATWMTQLNTALTQRFLHKVPSLIYFNDMFDRVGVKCVQKLNILGADWMKDYFNFEGPLDDTWRKSASYWSYATVGELEEVKGKIRDLKAAGELEEWGREHDLTHSAGMLTVMFCQRR